MPPYRKPTFAEHSVATWIVGSTWVISAWAEIWAVLESIAIVRRTGLGIIGHATVFEAICLTATLVLAILILFGAIRLVIAFVDWVLWAWQTPPAPGPDDVNEDDVP